MIEKYLWRLKCLKAELFEVADILTKQQYLFSTFTIFLPGISFDLLVTVYRSQLVPNILEGFRSLLATIKEDVYSLHYYQISNLRMGQEKF